MAERQEFAHPPSDPRPIAGRAGRVGAAPHPLSSRPVRIQLAAAVGVGVVMIASGLYLWRRPRESRGAKAATAALTPPSAPVAAAAPSAVAAEADADKQGPVALSDIRVLGCHDRGPKVTPPDRCDHLTAVDKALAAAVEKSASCVPGSAGAGTIEYVLDVSFLHHRVRLKLPRVGRSVHDRKVLHVCASAVRAAMEELSLDGIDHEHALYRLAVTATYHGTAEDQALAAGRAASAQTQTQTQTQ